MVTKSLLGVVDSIGESVATAFMPISRPSRESRDTLREIDEVRRATRYHRERFLRESERRSRMTPSQRDVHLAVLEALKRERAGE
jgi:hypothetical protein